MTGLEAESLLAAYADAVRIPTQRDKVYKDECFFSFDSPESDDGLFVCMNSFLGFGKKFVERYHEKTGRKLFLRRKRIKRFVAGGGGRGPVDGDGKEIPEKVSRLAIGVEGGFNPDAGGGGGKKFEYVEDNALVLIPEYRYFSLDDVNLPSNISMCFEAIVSADSATKRRELEAAACWEGVKVRASKDAEALRQLDNGVKVPPRGWKCHKCDLTTNLWLNLTDGTVSCGRRFFDGSGGNNHAVEHFRSTRFPLAVKLGTITADGKADVFSYAEDDMVDDPHLQRHLAHFGINASSMEKTDKSMVELEIDANQRADEWLTLTESGSKLRPVYGPGFTGMHNLGNTCYMNSVMQVLFTVPAFTEQYVEGAVDVFDDVRFNNVHFEDDFRFQMCKLGHGLWSGDYSVRSEDDDGDGRGRRGIRPNAFKNLIGRGSGEFAGKQQQDAQEFFLHLLTTMERENKRCGRTNHAFRCMQFEVEDRHECGITGKVKYMTRVEDYLPLSIPLEEAVNKDRVDEYRRRKVEVEAAGGRLRSDDHPVRPLIPFDACVSKFCEEEQVQDFYSSAAKAKTFARKTMRLKTFPDYLLIQLKKFDVDSNWVPYELDVEVAMPDVIDLGALRTAGGPKEGEEMLPRDEEQPAASAAAAALQPSPEIVAQLGEMGFSIEGCKKAAFHTGNSGVEAAMNWIMEHMEDADFNDPFVNLSLVKSGGDSQTGFVPDEEALATLTAMSFARPQAVKALKNTDNNVERAVDWIFSHPDDVETEEEEATAAAAPDLRLTDGSSKYSMKAFISHMGTSHLVGHYVCHILKRDQWFIYNDEKVALSENPPKNLGYLYLYERQQ